jgi:hypothetical protein
MKKALFLLLLVPFMGFTQNLVTWNTTSATNTNTHVTGNTIQTAGGVSLESTGWGGFRIGGQNYGSSNNAGIDYSKYIEFSVTTNTGYSLSPVAFNFIYNGAEQSPVKLQVRYSTSASFTGNGTQLGATQNIAAGENNLSLGFPANYTVASGATLYIRVYGYREMGDWWYSDFYLRNTTSNPNTNGPTITGTTANAGNVIVQPTATNDNATTVKNNSVAVNVLNNDNAGSGTVTNVAVTTQPSHGTAVVQANNTILYTPANNYTGIDSFVYRFTNSNNNTASATVNLSITQPALGTSALNGTYVISATSQATYPQFATITAAVAHLNNYGISGPVTFLLKDAAYSANESFPFTINTIANSSATNTVTFKPAAGVNATITTTNINNYTGVPGVFYLNGADNIIFDGSNAANGTTKNLTINNADTIDYVQRSVIWIASNGSNGATNITVKNCNIKQVVKNSGSSFCVGVYSGNNGTGNNNTMNVGAATANNANLLVTNNDFINVKQGIYINGGDTATTNVTVTNNDLGSENNTETIISPATFSNVDGFEYSDNLIYNLYRDSDAGSLVSAGVYVTGTSKNGSILRNNMSNLTRTVSNSQVFAGVVLASSESNANILVANNFILNVAAAGNGGGYSNGYGIVADKGGNYKIYHNTVSLNTNQPDGGYSAALYVNTAASNLDVRNNIFVNNQTNTLTRRSAIMVINTAANMSSVFSNLDYNDYFSDDRIGYVANTNGIDTATWSDNPDFLYTLQAWKSVTNKDAHTLNLNPGFASASDLHLDAYAPVNVNLNNLGTPLSAVTKDIDGQMRNTATPDMGADEFGPLTMPAPGATTGIYCDNATTWNGTAWSNGEPAADKDVIFNASYTQAGNTLYACSIFVLNNASVNFISNATAVVTHSVNVAETATLTFESSSNLMQVENDANSGLVTIKRNSSKLRRLDYTMWTAPVFDARTTGFQSLLAFSPATMANRFYEYSTTADLYQALPSETTKFAKGKGYLIRMPNGDSAEGYNAGTARIIYNGSFIGTPNNGNIRVALNFGGNGYNAVGNPYPSPINVQDFINANIDVIEGTIWMWRKTNNSTVATYSAVNLTGYVANNALGGGGVSGADGNDLITDPYAIDPKGSINTAQGFVVKAKVANKEIVFRNNMRISTHSNTFFRTTAPSATNEAQVSRLWLNISNTVGNFSQTLIGYNSTSTTGYDNGYDGEVLAEGNLSFYSLLQTEGSNRALTIQARGAFAAQDRVNMGYNATLSGTYTIAIDHNDGIFNEGQIVYLTDNATGLVHNLTEGSYTFATEAGVFNDRFVVTYTTDEQLGTDNPVVQTKALVVYKDGKQIKIDAPSDISAVTVYDMLGKMIYQKNNIDGMQFATSDIAVASQVIIVQITLDNQQVVSKKIIMN